MIHWKAGAEEAAGENAGKWIHWYAITIGIFVIIPRALLAIFWRTRSAHLSRTLPFREVSPGYFDHLLAISTGSSLTVSIVPYPVSPDEAMQRRILRTLEDQFEKPVGINWLAAVDFGEEEEAAPGLEGEVIPLFDFASTPEKETQLALYQTLSGAAPNPLRFALLETSSFDRKTESLPDGKERKQARMSAWKNLFEAESVDLISVVNTTTSNETTTA